MYRWTCYQRSASIALLASCNNRLQITWRRYIFLLILLGRNNLSFVIFNNDLRLKASVYFMNYSLQRQISVLNSRPHYLLNFFSHLVTSCGTCCAHIDTSWQVTTMCYDVKIKISDLVICMLNIATNSTVIVHEERILQRIINPLAYINH